MSKIQGIFGDPKARVIRLKRTQKKQHVVAAAPYVAAITTRQYGGFGTSHAGTHGSTWKWKFGGFGARGAEQ